MIKLIQIIVLFIIIALALFINCYPNYYAFLKTPVGYDFSGQASWFDPWDLNVYVAAIRWGQNGHILLENLYTSDSNSGILLYPIYTLTGWLFRQTQPFFLFHVSAILFGLLFAFLSWGLIKIFLKSAFDNILAVFVLLFGGGLGWLFFGQIKVADLYMTGFTSISQLQRSHEAIGMIIYFTSLVMFYLACDKRKFIFNLFSIVFLLLLTFTYPYYYLSYFSICGIYSLLKFLKTADRIYLKFITLNLLISAPVLFFYYQHIHSNAAFNSVFLQKLNTPNLMEVLLGYGILTILLLIQLKSKDHNEERLFLNLWFFMSLFLSYFPLGFARFYQRGLYFPLTILAVYGLDYLKNNYPGLKMILTAVIIIFVPISTIFMFQLRLEETGKNNPWYYQPKETGLVLTNLSQQIPYKDAVLTSYNMGNYIPAHSNLRVYLGHSIQTNDAEAKAKKIYNFYANNYSEIEAREFLRQNHIKYVWYGPLEKQITSVGSSFGRLKYSFLFNTTGLGNNEVFQINDQN